MYYENPIKELNEAIEKDKKEEAIYNTITVIGIITIAIMIIVIIYSIKKYFQK